jgi:hypothetical protein
MALMRINTTPSRRQALSFAALWLPGFLLLVAALLWRRQHSLPLSGALVGVAVLSALVGLAVPAAARALFVGAMYVTFPIGWVVSHVLLLVIYYVVFTPVGLIGRLFGYDPMRRRFDREARSYWVEHEAPSETTSYFRQS